MFKDKLKEEPKDKKITSEVKTEIKLEPESDKFSDTENKSILAIVRGDVDYGIKIQEEYVTQKALDLKHYHGAKPSVLENLDKENWMSDRNLGLARAMADSYQATLLATCWNPDSINFIATRVSDINNRNNQEKFTKWGMGKQEANTFPEVDDFIHNRIVVGTSFFKIYRKITEEWVDTRIPKQNEEKKTYKWDIKTEKQRFERGVIENIPDIDDILLPSYGKNIQELPFFIQRLHLDGETVIDLINRKIFVPKDPENYKNKLGRITPAKEEETLKEEKQETLGINDKGVTNTNTRRVSVTLYEWYGYFTKNNRTEKFRFIVDLDNDEVLSGKTLRKINRSGKIPFVGGSLCAEPGQLRGVSLMQIIAPIVNAFNNVFNQKSDFQYVTNCPFGFYQPEEGYTKSEYKLKPMTMYPVADPSKINIPNIQRSMAWAESDMRILFEVLERLTGASTYFSVGQQRNKTLGQDMLVDKQSETRFGLWVSRIQEDICEAISMWFQLYQDYPPEGLSERAIGVDGEKLFPNLSIDSLRGEATIQMTPDTVAGSKAFHKRLRMWMLESSQGNLWVNPQLNPSGNWNLWADSYRDILGYTDSDIRRYMGEEPKTQFNAEDLDNEWIKFMNGEKFDPPEGDTPLAIQHFQGHLKQKDEKYHLLPEEYRGNFDAHLFKTLVNSLRAVQNAQKEAISSAIAAKGIMANQPPQQTENAQAGVSMPPQQSLPGVTPGQEVLGG